MFYVKFCKSVKNGTLYCGLFVDLEYRQVGICFDRYLIAEILGLSVKELMTNRVVGDVIFLDK